MGDGDGDYMLSESESEIGHSQSELNACHETWNPNQFAHYISLQGLGDEYTKCIIEHKISGKLAPLLSELDLKEMGIECIGDR